MLSQLSYDPIFLLRLFPLLFVVFTRSFSHILTYAPSFAHFDASIKEKILAKINFSVFSKTNCVGALSLNRAFFKEVIQPQVPLRLPCYDFTPVMNHTVANVPPKVRLSASGAAHSHGVTGGVYKARERIHRNMLICDY